MQSKGVWDRDLSVPRVCNDRLLLIGECAHDNFPSYDRVWESGQRRRWIRSKLEFGEELFLGSSHTDPRLSTTSGIFEWVIEVGKNALGIN